ncbi:MAG TPA: hypothetical protein VGH63_03325, partial [Polyangia bacterium]
SDEQRSAERAGAQTLDPPFGERRKDQDRFDGGGDLVTLEPIEAITPARLDGQQAVIDPKKLEDFEQYARHRPSIARRCGGELVGYSLPTKLASSS